MEMIEHVSAILEKKIFNKLRIINYLKYKNREGTFNNRQHDCLLRCYIRYEIEGGERRGGML